MQCPAESRDEDMGLQWSLAVSTSYQWHEASILTALSPGSCQARFQWEEKKQKTQAVGIKQRVDYPRNMSLSRTVHLWIPHGSERKKRHHFSAWLLQMQSVFFCFYPSPLTLMPCLQTLLLPFPLNLKYTIWHWMWHFQKHSLWHLFSHTRWNPAITPLNKQGVEYISGAVVCSWSSSGFPPKHLRKSTSVSLIGNVSRQIVVLLCCSHCTPSVLSSVFVQVQ